jgi:protein TonB
VWKCPFPPEANAEHINHAEVRVQAEVSETGAATAIIVLVDPGSGFGREARACAMRHTYQPALDHDGKPTAGTTLPFIVHFDR